jgi:hypothetical protein
MKTKIFPSIKPASEYQQNEFLQSEKNHEEKVMVFIFTKKHYFC